MRMHSLNPLFSKRLLVLFTLLSISASAEHSNEALQAKRSKAPAVMSDKEIGFLGKWFRKVPEALKLQYQDEKRLAFHLPYGITDALDKEAPNQEILATVISELMAFQSGEDVKATRDAAQKKAAEERAKDARDRDDRFLTLLERVEWAANFRLKEPLKVYPTDSPLAEKEPQLKQFNELLKKGFSDGDKQRIEMEDQLAKAAQGGQTGEQARAWLRNNLDLRSLPLQLEGLLGKAEGEKKFDSLLDAMSVVGSQGQREAHFVHAPTGTHMSLRLNPDRAEARKDFSKFAEKMKGSGNFAFTSSPNLSLDETQKWWRGKDGEMTNAALVAGKATGENTSSQFSSGAADPTPAVKAFFATNGCSSCHGGSIIGNDIKSLRFIKEGQSFNIAGVLRALKTNSAMASKGIGAAFYDQLAQWAALQ